MEIIEYQNTLKDELLFVWEKAVVATHDFLNESDFLEIKAFLSACDFCALEIFCPVEKGLLVGFIGLDGHKIVMFFIHPDYFGKGLGKELLNFAIAKKNANVLDVNEQNPKGGCLLSKKRFCCF